MVVLIRLDVAKNLSATIFIHSFVIQLIKYIHSFRCMFLLRAANHFLMHLRRREACRIGVMLE